MVKVQKVTINNSLVKLDMELPQLRARRSHEKDIESIERHDTKNLPKRIYLMTKIWVINQATSVILEAE